MMGGARQYIVESFHCDYFSHSTKCLPLKSHAKADATIQRVF
jgi:hypothetical protein